jgi:hypothetical protein
MLIGVPREIKQDEHRVGLTPTSVRELVHHGHQVVVESGAGAGIGMYDDDYTQAGATILPTAAAVYAQAGMIVKVKELQAVELPLLRAGQLLFTYLHLAPDAEQTAQLLKSGVVAIAYETVTGPNHSLPLLSPMSEVAGRMAVQAGAHCLEREAGGPGILLGGVPGVKAANVVVLGGGVVGTNAIRVAMGMEAQVTVIDRSLPRLKELDFQFGGRLNTIFPRSKAIAALRRGSRSGDRCGAGAGCAAPKAGDRGTWCAACARLGAGRCGHRPGRLLRDQPADHARRTHLHRGRRGALLRGEHARRGGAHLDLRAEQRHAALRAGAGRQGLQAGAAR